MSFLSLYDVCRQAPNRYSVAVCFASAAYAGKLPEKYIPTLVAFTLHPALLDKSPPAHPTYRISDKYNLDRKRVKGCIENSQRLLRCTPANAIPREPNETTQAWKRRQKTQYNVKTDLFKTQLIQICANAWPKEPQIPEGEHGLWFDVTACFAQVNFYFQSCSRNGELRNHLQDVEQILSGGSTTAIDKASVVPKATPCVPSLPNPQLPSCLSLKQMLTDRKCPATQEVLRKSLVSMPSGEGLPIDTNRLESLLNKFHGTRDLDCYYRADLEASCRDLAQTREQASLKHPPSQKRLKKHIKRSKKHLIKNFNLISKALGPITSNEKIVSTAGVWPRLLPRTLLGQLASPNRSSCPPAWIKTLCIYARSFVEHQRAERLLGLSLTNQEAELFKELDPTNEDTIFLDNNPDWLLVQIDGNFSIRSIQTQVAREMISPRLAHNSVLQLNMGEGKSSVIVPIIAAVLADLTQLVRVVVLKPLWQEMFHLLVTRLSGLVNRRIWYLPFSRHTSVGEDQAKQIQKAYEKCKGEGGILLVQPEHILSFKLMSINQLLSPSGPNGEAASSLSRETQAWLSKHSRDILDESDEILHVRYQLVYAIGDQQPLDGHPERWKITQQVLSLVGEHLKLMTQNPGYRVQYVARPDGRFPSIRILPESADTVSVLVLAIAKDVTNGRVSGLNLALHDHQDAISFMTDKKCSARSASFRQTLDPVTQQGLLLLRGLLACGILVFTLRDKHYCVDYGLDLKRSPLAVPYRAKDVPSPRAEFGHPDVAIVLTYLSYYNAGLTHDQLRACFEILYKGNNPELEYEQWVQHNEKTPEQLRQLDAVNLRDHEQFVEQLVPVFGCNSVVIDFFLSSVVFPMAAKQFSHKLSTSAWDLAEKKDCATTGFSGTKDNGYLLPTSIKQHDPVKQSSTNALVLNHLLLPENKNYRCIRGGTGARYSVEEFLGKLVEETPEIRVLVDVGAQMLDLGNEALVRNWMKLQPHVAAGVYFDDQDQLMVLPRDSLPTTFHSSSFSQQLKKCIVYLDDEHTRGTDLKLPPGFRAAVTLGPKVTKDRLLQACMRMRNLGRGEDGHSIVFFAPGEIDDQIRQVKQPSPSNRIDSCDVVRWALLRTCDNLRNDISHWAQQGVEYSNRKAVQETAQVEAIKQKWKLADSQSLEEMYDVSEDAATAQSFARTAFETENLKARLEHLGIKESELVDPSMGEEQQREVSLEAEYERQIERPPISEPATHSIHTDVRRFVESGTISVTSTGVVPLFHPLRSSGLFQPGLWLPELLASVDFCKTLTTTDCTQLSKYMRPVHWVISGRDNLLMAVSPYEVDQLLPAIRDSKSVRLHVFTPRVMQSMLSFSDLRYYSVPSVCPPPPLRTRLQLSLFAGQLYLDNYAEYRTMCALLGLYLDRRANDEAEAMGVQRDGFVVVAAREALAVRYPEYLDCTFPNSPVKVLNELIDYRRKGMEFKRTHMGNLLQATPLTENDFQPEEGITGV